MSVRALLTGLLLAPTVAAPGLASAQQQAGAPATGVTAGPAAPIPGAPFAGLRFLLGEWTASQGGGAPGQATAGGFTFSLALDGRVAVRRSFSEYAPKAGQVRGVRHEDLTVIHATPDGLRATYWDNEGHVVEYAITTEPGRAVFESVGGGQGPRFRLSYQQLGPAQVDITFSIAAPGAEFRTYVKGVADRKGG